jgi:CPA1 family monovalent cation:H+ antiporter
MYKVNALSQEININKKTFEENAIPILTWVGLRGGISVALALSLPASSFNEVFVSVTIL